MTGNRYRRWEKWTRVFSTRHWVIHVARTCRKKEKKIACPWYSYYWKRILIRIDFCQVNFLKKLNNYLMKLEKLWKYFFAKKSRLELILYRSWWIFFSSHDCPCLVQRVGGSMRTAPSQKKSCKFLCAIRRHRLKEKWLWK